MAFLYIRESPELRVRAGGGVQAPEAPSLVEQRIANDGASTQSAAFSSATRFIEVHSDSICSILVGANPVAVTSKGRMAAGETRYYRVNAGDRIAAVLNT
jgi:hypothetical protein